MQKVFNECIVDALEGKTRVVAMNQLHFLSKCDHVISLGDGRIEEQGTFQELMDSNGTLSQLYTKYVADEAPKAKEPTKPPLSMPPLEQGETKSSLSQEGDAGQLLSLCIPSFPMRTALCHAWCCSDALS